MSELKPCPFCGGTKICTEKGINLNNYCDNCSAESNVEHWNTRPVEDALNARISELSQAVGLITTLKPTMVMDADHPLDMAKEGGFDWAWLGVWEHNVKAQGFYRKYGFEKFSEHSFKVGDKVDTDWLLRKALKE